MASGKTWRPGKHGVREKWHPGKHGVREKWRPGKPGVQENLASRPNTRRNNADFQAKHHHAGGIRSRSSALERAPAQALHSFEPAVYVVPLAPDVFLDFGVR